MCTNKHVNKLMKSSGLSQQKATCIHIWGGNRVIRVVRVMSVISEMRVRVIRVMRVREIRVKGRVIRVLEIFK